MIVCNGKRFCIGNKFHADRGCRKRFLCKIAAFRVCGSLFRSKTAEVINTIFFCHICAVNLFFEQVCLYFHHWGSPFCNQSQNNVISFSQKINRNNKYCRKKKMIFFYKTPLTFFLNNTIITFDIRPEKTVNQALALLMNKSEEREIRIPPVIIRRSEQNNDINKNNN